MTSNAKSAAPAGADETRLMVQALLADRFQLKIRRETKETPAYALIVANGKTHKMTLADKSGCEPEPSPRTEMPGCVPSRNSGLRKPGGSAPRASSRTTS